MAVPKAKVFAVLQDEGATVAFRRRLIWITLNGRQAQLPISEEYKIREVGCMVAQLHIEKDRARKHIPEI